MEIVAGFGGFLLVYRARDDERIHGDSLWETVAEAEREAERRFGVHPEEWRPA